MIILQRAMRLPDGPLVRIPHGAVKRRQSSEKHPLFILVAFPLPITSKQLSFEFNNHKYLFLAVFLKGSQHILKSHYLVAITYGLRLFHDFPGSRTPYLPVFLIWYIGRTFF